MDPIQTSIKCLFACYRMRCLEQDKKHGLWVNLFLHSFPFTTTWVMKKYASKVKCVKLVILNIFWKKFILEHDFQKLNVKYKLLINFIFREHQSKNILTKIIVAKSFIHEWILSFICLSIFLDIQRCTFQPFNISLLEVLSF